ncbi:uncharacterized protein [Aegilops tauschii subsp. strangulata]|uniref:uncharacterized protein n=1 Tax=Aegilops tauschii subsp. strangulata TaxID=200361 RepID=UPI003CC864F0
MEAYLAEVRRMEKQFLGLELKHVPRDANREADAIARGASRRQPQEPGVFEERLFKPSAAPMLSSATQPQEELPQPPVSGAPACGPASGVRLLLALEPQEGCWTMELKDYLMQGTLPEKDEAVEPLDDAIELVKACEAYQFHTKKIQQPAKGLQTIPLSWPFAAERANAEVLKGLKTRTFKKKLEACGKGWYDELQSVLWSICTTATKSTGETLFFLVYGAEAVLPHKVKHHSARVLAFDEAPQDAMRGMDLVLGEGHRWEAALRAARYQQALR